MGWSEPFLRASELLCRRRILCLYIWSPNSILQWRIHLIHFWSIFSAIPSLFVREWMDDGKKSCEPGVSADSHFDATKTHCSLDLNSSSPFIKASWTTVAWSIACLRCTGLRLIIYVLAPLRWHSGRWNRTSLLSQHSNSSLTGLWKAELAVSLSTTRNGHPDEVHIFWKVCDIGREFDIEWSSIELVMENLVSNIFRQSVALSPGFFKCFDRSRV